SAVAVTVPVTPAPSAGDVIETVGAIASVGTVWPATSSDVNRSLTATAATTANARRPTLLDERVSAAMGEFSVAMTVPRDDSDPFQTEPSQLVRLSTQRSQRSRRR